MTCTITETAPYFSDITSDQKQRLIMTILDLLRQGYSDFYLNCERGITLYAAEAICILKEKLAISLHIAVPFENQCAEWSEEERDRYYAIHEKADTIEFVYRRFQPDCYILADKAMLDKSDLLLVFGDKAAACHAVEYAAEIGVRIHHHNIKKDG